MDAAALGIAAAPRPSLDRDRLRDVILLRLAVAGKALSREAVAKDVASARRAPGRRGPMGRAHRARSCGSRRCRSRRREDRSAFAQLTPASSEPRSSSAARHRFRSHGPRRAIRASSRARSVSMMSRRRNSRRLARPDALRAAIVVKAFGLKVRGTPSPVRLRTALAKVALARAFKDAAGVADGRADRSVGKGRQRTRRPPRAIAAEISDRRPIDRDACGGARRFAEVRHRVGARRRSSGGMSPRARSPPPSGSQDASTEAGAERPSHRNPLRRQHPPTLLVRPPCARAVGTADTRCIRRRRPAPRTRLGRGLHRQSQIVHLAGVACGRCRARALGSDRGRVQVHAGGSAPARPPRPRQRRPQGGPQPGRCPAERAFVPQ